MMQSEIHNPRSAIRRAFTLVEMFVVVLIVALGFMLVAGVGSTAQEDLRSAETRDTESIVLSALSAYHGVHKTYPPGDGGPDSSVALLRALRSEPACREILQRLSQDAVYFDVDNKGGEYLLDGFANPLLYDRNGGLGGRRPLLISKGQDPTDPTDDIVSE